MTVVAAGTQKGLTEERVFRCVREKRARKKVNQGQIV